MVRAHHFIGNNLSKSSVPVYCLFIFACFFFLSWQFFFFFAFSYSLFISPVHGYSTETRCQKGGGGVMGEGGGDSL